MTKLSRITPMHQFLSKILLTPVLKGKHFWRHPLRIINIKLIFLLCPKIFYKSQTPLCTSLKNYSQE